MDLRKTKEEENMYCPECGARVKGEEKFCPTCGAAVSGGGSGRGAVSFGPAQQRAATEDLLLQLSKKVKVEAIVWCVIAALQVLIGFSMINEGAQLDTLGSVFGVANAGAERTGMGFAILIVAAVNFYVCSKDFKYSREVLKNPSGIVKKYRPLAGLVINLAYNLIVGGVIGVVGSVFWFITRSFVMNHEKEFEAIETGYQGNAR